jgi:hypothetical protein
VQFHAEKTPIRAADMKLTDEQRIKVMNLVKDGKLTVDQAMDKVLKVEGEIAEKEKEVCFLSHPLYFNTRV